MRLQMEESDCLYNKPVVEFRENRKLTDAIQGICLVY